MLLLIAIYLTSNRVVLYMYYTVYSCVWSLLLFSDYCLCKATTPLLCKYFGFWSSYFELFEFLILSFGSFEVHSLSVAVWKCSSPVLVLSLKVFKWKKECDLWYETKRFQNVHFFLNSKCRNEWVQRYGCWYVIAGSDSYLKSLVQQSEGKVQPGTGTQ